jgi:predicted TIM-barrel fold metal-dependent hydrolase
MKIIDCHTHCWPDDVAERALANLSNEYMITPAFDGTVKGLLKMMDADGVYASIVVPVATKPSQVIPINDWIAGIKNDRIIGFGSMHPDFPDPAEEFRRMESLGISGIKIQSNWQRCRPDDPRMFPIYEAAGDKFVVVFHAGGELKVMEEQLAPPESIAKVHKAFPNLKIVAAHLGGYRMWDEVEEELIGKDLYLDLSCCFPQDISDERLISMMRAHGIEKILFASDAPCAGPGPQFDRIMSLPLTDDEKEMIAWRNVEGLLGWES